MLCPTSTTGPALATSSVTSSPAAAPPPPPPPPPTTTSTTTRTHARAGLLHAPRRSHQVEFTSLFAISTPTHPPTAAAAAAAVHRRTHPGAVAAMVLYGTGPGFGSEKGWHGWNQQANKLAAKMHKKGKHALGQFCQ